MLHETYTCPFPDGINHNVRRQDLIDRDVRVLVYIDSYVAHTVKKRLKCSVCASKLSFDQIFDAKMTENTYLRVLDRGGLKWPSEFKMFSCSNIFKFCTGNQVSVRFVNMVPLQIIQICFCIRLLTNILLNKHCNRLTMKLQFSKCQERKWSTLGLQRFGAISYDSMQCFQK